MYVCVVAAERYDPEADDDDGAKVRWKLFIKYTWGQRSNFYVLVVCVERQSVGSECR